MEKIEPTPAMLEAERMTKKLQSMQQPNFEHGEYCIRVNEEPSTCALADILENIPYPVSNMTANADGKGRFLYITAEDKQKTDQQLKQMDRQKRKKAKERSDK